MHYPPPFPRKYRNKILSYCIGKVSLTAEIKTDVHFTGNRITIEDNVFINKFCRIFSHDCNGGEVYLGRNVVLAMGVTLTTHTHDIGNGLRRAPRETKLYPIRIEEGCWLGANVTVLPGVTIGHGTIIGAGSVVIKNCEANSLYAGNPAKLIKKYDTK